MKKKQLLAKGRKLFLYCYRSFNEKLKKVIKKKFNAMD